MIAQPTVSRFIVHTPQLLESLQQGLPSPYRLRADAMESRPAHILDTFDDSLYGQGQLLLQSDRELLFLGEQIVASPLKGRKALAFKQDIDDPKMLESLSAVSPLRRLLPEYEVSLAHCDAAMVDDNDKTCVRLRIIAIERGEKAATMIELHPLRGYQTESAILSNLILSLGARHDAKPAELLQTFDHSSHGYERNPDIEFEEGVSVQTAATLITNTFLAIARSNEQGVIDDLDTEFLHDYRVSLRRIRSLISLFKGVWEPQAQQQLKQRFSALMKITNRLRDLDVYLLDQAEYYEMVPESMHPGLDQIFASFRREHKRVSRKVASHLQSEAYQSEIAALQQLFDSEENLAPGVDANEPALDYARSMLRKHYKRVCRIARGIHADTPDEEVHRLRIQCKKLRYLLDFFSPLLGKKTVRALIKSLKKLQDNLGRFNDYSSQQLSLRAFLDQQLQHKKNVSPAMIESIGALIAIKHKLQIEERARVMESFANFNNEETRQLFDSICSKPAAETPAP